MNSILIIAHSPFAQALRQCALHVFPDCEQAVIALDVLPNVSPEETLAAHTEFTPRVVRLIFTEKIRHGLFLNYSGTMPPFSTERLSDQDISDLLAPVTAQAT